VNRLLTFCLAALPVPFPDGAAEKAPAAHPHAARTLDNVGFLVSCSVLGPDWISIRAIALLPIFRAPSVLDCELLDPCELSLRVGKRI